MVYRNDCHQWSMKMELSLVSSLGILLDSDWDGSFLGFPFPANSDDFLGSHRALAFFQPEVSRENNPQGDFGHYFIFSNSNHQFILINPACTMRSSYILAKWIISSSSIFNSPSTILTGSWTRKNPSGTCAQYWFNRVAPDYYFCRILLWNMGILYGSAVAATHSTIPATMEFV